MSKLVLASTMQTRRQAHLNAVAYSFTITPRSWKPWAAKVISSPAVVEFANICFKGELGCRCFSEVRAETSPLFLQTTSAPKISIDYSSARPAHHIDGYRAKDGKVKSSSLEVSVAGTNHVWRAVSFRIDLTPSISSIIPPLRVRSALRSGSLQWPRSF